MGFCLPKELSNKFIQSLKTGETDPAKLSEMSSSERHAYFAKLIGPKEARDINALFESKLLLKNQQLGMINWAKQIVGITPEVKRDIISRIEKMDRVLSERDQQGFLEDLASKRLGTDVSIEEANTIAKLSKDLTEAKAKLNPNEPIGSPARLTYGAKKVALQNYVSELKLTNEKTTLRGEVGKFKQDPLGTIREDASKIAGISKGIKASLDNSALFRQGWKTLFTNPNIWARNALNSFSNIARQLGKDAKNSEVLDGIKADIYSRPNAINGLYTKMKLDIGDLEEAYPTTLPEKIPLFGRLYKASEVAYTGFLYRMRADIADKVSEIAKGNGVDITNAFEARSIGKLVNSLTGRGDLGSFEKIGKQVNTIFFSPKMVKSQFDFLTLHASDKMSTFARKQAALNLLKVASGMGVILGVANALQPGSVEFDPRSADFGKIRIKDTRFDVSGGMGSMITLAARLLKQSSKSSTTGVVSPLNSGKYGALTSTDVFVNYLENKLSPAASVIKDIANQRDFQGNPITLKGEASNLLVPLPITTAQELMSSPNAANPFISEMADALGIVTNTYSPKKK